MIGVRFNIANNDSPNEKSKRLFCDNFVDQGGKFQCQKNGIDLETGEYPCLLEGECKQCDHFVPTSGITFHNIGVCGGHNAAQEESQYEGDSLEFSCGRNYIDGD